jgi:glycosyltransferase involved in cell wall biosynthesis
VRDRPIAVRPQLAYFSPLPPDRSGIADYSSELLPFLAELAQVTLFATHPERVSDELRTAFDVRPIWSYSSESWRYDVALYHMGNSTFHDALYRVLLRNPGITVIHDVGLHDFIAARTLAKDDFAGYVRELGYALGSEGVELAYQIRQGRAEPPVATVPLNERLLDHSLGVIVHSQHAERRIRETRPHLPIAVIPAPIRTGLGPLRSRSELGCPEGALLFACAGRIFPHKQVASALDAFARLRGDFPQARFVVIGDDLTDTDLQRWLRERALEDAVFHTGFQTELRDYVSWIAAADVLINLRSPTLGETSATVLRGLAVGRPVIVSDHGWYAELPEAVCVKITPDDVEALYEAMRRLAGDPLERAAVGRQAAAYVQRQHGLAVAAQKYLDFIEELLGPGVMHGPTQHAQPDPR